MKNLNRNTKTINIAYYLGKQKTTLGTKIVEIDVWDNAFETSANVSLPSGNIISELFGTIDSYDLILTTTDTSLKINENTKIWVYNIPNIKQDNNDYIVKNYKMSINSISIGLSKRITSGMKDLWLSYDNGKPYKIRLNTEVIGDGVIAVYVDKNDNVTIDEITLIWFNKDYSEDYSDYNYIYDSKYSYKNITKYILIERN